MRSQSEFTLAAIQAAPHFLDREASCEKACNLIVEAAQKDANLAAFGETWLPGYPFFLSSDLPVVQDAAAQYLESAVEIPSPITDRLCQAAGDAGIDVVIGVSEKDSNTHGTVYCTLLFISSEGRILGRHRKLKPTGLERLAWGEGDGSSLRTYRREYGRIGGLNCWEHVMMVPAYALISQGIQIHVASWPFPPALERNGRGKILTQALAVQGACYVISVTGFMDLENVPEQYREIDVAFRTKSSIGSCIIAPNSEVLAEAPPDEEAIITARGSLDFIRRAKIGRDISGHYSRPDVLHLEVNQQKLDRSVFLGTDPPESFEEGNGSDQPAIVNELDLR